MPTDVKTTAELYSHMCCILLFTSVYLSLVSSSSNVSIGNSWTATKLLHIQTNKQTLCPLLYKRTMLAERTALVGKDSTNFAGREVSRGKSNGSPRPLATFSWTRDTDFLSNSSIILMNLSAPCSRPTTSQKTLAAPGTEPGTCRSVASNSDH
jgi:hypothetical protein